MMVLKILMYMYMHVVVIMIGVVLKTRSAKQR